MLRDPKTGGLLSVANAEAVQPIARPPATMPGVLAGILGLLALACAIPVTLSGFGVVVPAWLVGTAASLSPLLSAGAYWAAGGNPLELITRFSKTPPPSSPPPPAPRVGPPEA